MTTKHTPGEWVVDADGDVCTDDLERLVAAVDWRHVSLRDGEAEANARLIAAAPDLLAACERFLAAQRMAETDGRAGFGLYTEAIEAAEAAVKKARGEP